MPKRLDNGQPVIITTCFRYLFSPSTDNHNKAPVVLCAHFYVNITTEIL